MYKLHYKEDVYEKTLPGPDPIPKLRTSDLLLIPHIQLIDVFVVDDTLSCII